MKFKKQFSAAQNRLLSKLRSRAGETISETMISVLVAALATVMLAGAVSAASNNIAKSRDKMDTYYSENETLVMMSGSGPTVFGIFTDPEKAKAALEVLRAEAETLQVKQVYLTEPYQPRTGRKN